MTTSSPEAGTPRPGHPAPWLLERLAFEPEAAAPEIRRHVDGCAECRAAVAELGEARRRFLAEHPARPFVAGVVERAAREEAGGWSGRAGRWWRSRWLLPAAAAAALLLAILPLRAHREEAVHLKGGPALRLFVARGGGPARPLEPGAPLRPGDLLRFGVVTDRPGQALVASVDEQGRISRYHPPGATAGEPLRGTGELQLLPGSVELDETTGREWIVLLLSPAPLPEERVREALLAAWRGRQGDRLGPLALDADTAVVAVEKAAP